MFQMDIGHSWIVSQFPFLEDKVDTIWQIDPFGSSATTPLLFGGRFKHALLNRVGDFAKNELKKRQSLSFMWSNPLNEDKHLLTHVLPEHYQTQQFSMLKGFLDTDKVFGRSESEDRKRMKKVRDLIIGPMLE
jgi:hypothetical protein